MVIGAALIVSLNPPLGQPDLAVRTGAVGNFRDGLTGNLSATGAKGCHVEVFAEDN
jgi:hypothetical protein